MFRFSEKYGSAPSTPEDSPSRRTPRSRLGSWNLTPRRVVFIILALFSLVFLSSFLSLFSNHGVCITFLSLCWILFYSPSDTHSLVVQPTLHKPYHTMPASSPTLPSSLLSHSLTATQTQSILSLPTNTATPAIFPRWISTLPSLHCVQTARR